MVGRNSAIVLMAYTPLAMSSMKGCFELFFIESISDKNIWALLELRYKKTLEKDKPGILKDRVQRMAVIILF